MKKILISTIALILSNSAFSNNMECDSHELKHWNTKSEVSNVLIDFVKEANDKNSNHYIEPENRIAVFDNDGTLWSEKPMYFQFLFAMDEIKNNIDKHPEWINKAPFKYVLNNDMKSLYAGGHKAILEIVNETHTGISVEEFQNKVDKWLKTSKHPELNKSYTDLTYTPMKEVISFLQENNFKTYIVSGGGNDFMRAWTKDIYNIPNEYIIGSALEYNYQYNNGKPVLIKTSKLNTLNDKDKKVENIQKIIGKKPVLAFGNSDGDQAMLQWVTSQDNSLGFIVHHTDEEREWKYDRESSVGHLDKALEQANKENNWHLIDMKNDWCKVF